MADKQEKGKLGWVEVVAFGVLEGSILVVGGVVAPRLFRRISSRDKAGRIFGQILKNWFWLGLSCLLTMLASTFRSVSQTRSLNGWLTGRLGLVVAMLGLLSYFRLILAKMDGIRAKLNAPIDTYPTENGPRFEFNVLHKRSTKVMQGVMGLGVVWLVFSLFFGAIQPKNRIGE